MHSTNVVFWAISNRPGPNPDLGDAMQGSGLLTHKGPLFSPSLISQGNGASNDRIYVYALSYDSSLPFYSVW
jgi:hypothetical protein